MSRHGYTDDYLPLFRATVTRAIRGKRGQAFLRDLAGALDAMPNKRLIAGALEQDGEVCAIGCLGVARGVDLRQFDVCFDPEGDNDLDDDYYLAELLADTFDISETLAREVQYVNDEGAYHPLPRTPEERWQHVRRWVAKHIHEEAT